MVVGAGAGVEVWVGFVLDRLAVTYMSVYDKLPEVAWVNTIEQSLYHLVGYEADKGVREQAVLSRDDLGRFSGHVGDGDVGFDAASSLLNYLPHALVSSKLVEVFVLCCNEDWIEFDEWGISLFGSDASDKARSSFLSNPGRYWPGVLLG